MKKCFIAVTLWVLVFGMTSTTQLQGSNDETVDGDFSSVGGNQAPLIDDVRLLTSPSETVVEPGFSLTPGFDYVLEFTVSEIYGLGNLGRMTVTLFYAPEASTFEEMRSLFDLTPKDTSDDGTRFVWQWNYDGTTQTSDMIGGETTSWGSHSFTFEDLNVLTDTVKVPIRLSDVTRHTTNEKWMIMIEVEDRYEGHPLSAFAVHGGYNVQSYVSIDVGGQIQWVDVIAGSDFTDNANSATLGNVQILSNGYFNQTISSSEHWVGERLGLDGSNVAATLLAEATEPQSFALRVYDAAQFLNSQPVTTTSTDFKLRSQTTEETITLDYTFWLRLNNDFVDDVYRGTLMAGVRPPIHEVLNQTQGVSGFFAEMIQTAQPNDQLVVLKEVDLGLDTVNLNQNIAIDFNGHKATGNLSVETEETIHVTLSGFGLLVGNLTVNGENLSVSSNLLVTQETIVEAVSTTTFSTSGEHRQGITLQGSGHVFSSRRVNVIIDTDQPVRISGLIEKLSIHNANADIELEANFRQLNATVPLDTVILGSPSGTFQGEGTIMNPRNSRLYVDLNEAITQAQAGDTLKLGPGVFTSSTPINLTKSLTLAGIQAGRSFDDLERDNETIIQNSVLRFNAPNITLDGILFKDTHLERFTSNANGLTLKNLIIHYDRMIDAFLNMSAPGNLYVIKGSGGVSHVTFENLLIKGPGKNAIVLEPSFMPSKPSDRYLGGIDFNNVQNSIIKNVRIEQLSRFGINVGNGSSGIILDTIAIDSVGFAESFFMAGVGLFGNSTAMTLKGNLDIKNTPLGMDIKEMFEDVATESFTLTTENVEIDILGFRGAPIQDTLALTLGATAKYTTESTLEGLILVSLYVLDSQHLPATVAFEIEGQTIVFTKENVSE